jgi:hypothetical protein
MYHTIIKDIIDRYDLVLRVVLFQGYLLLGTLEASFEIIHLCIEEQVYIAYCPG